MSAVSDLRDYPRVVAGSLRMLIPADLAGYSSMDLTSRRAIVVADPPDCVFPGGPDALAEFVHQNPMVDRTARAPASAMRLSDLISRRALHRTELYGYVYSRIPQEYMLGLRLSSGGWPKGRPGQLIALSLGRTRHDFADSHLRLLETLRPHLERTFALLSERAFLRAIVEGDPGHRSCWLLLVAPDGIVEWVSPAAASALELAPGASLSWTLRMMKPSASGRPTVTSINGIPVEARAIPDAYPGLAAVHLVPVSGRLHAAELCKLGLTRRQAEVLELAFTGMTASQIAEELTLSRRTVEKHLERTYARLGASNRTQAILAALDLAATRPMPARDPGAAPAAAPQAPIRSIGRAAGR